MPINKNAIIRYRTLDSCFRNPGRRFFIEDLVNSINEKLIENNGSQSRVKKRQVYNDINFMESETGWNAPIIRKKDGRRTYYLYEDINFSINNQPLNETEMEQLSAGINLLSRFRGIPQFDWLEEIINKLQTGAQPRHPSGVVVGLDENPYLVGIHFLGDLFNAIYYKKVLVIQYKDFKSAEAYPITFHPYFLKQYNNRWFVLGYNQENQEPTWNLAVDRIQKIDEIKMPYHENTDISWEEFFDDVIGVTKPVDVEPIDIELWFNSDTAPYIITKPLHGSQKVIKTDGVENGIKVKLNLIPNFEFYQLLLSHGKNVKVLSPPSVVEHLKEMLQSALHHYTSPFKGD